MTKHEQAIAELREVLEKNGGYLTSIDFDDAFEFAEEQLASLTEQRVHPLRIINAFRALLALRSTRSP